MDIIHDPIIKERNILVNFPELVEKLNLSLKEPSKASEHVKAFESKAFEVNFTIKLFSQNFQIYLNAGQSVEWLNKQESSGFLNESLLSSFRISSLLIIERYNELNYNILKGLLYLCVLGRDIGKTVVSIASNTEITNDICDIIIEVINPLLELYDNFPFVSSLTNYLLYLTRNLLISFSKLPVTAKLSNCLQPIIQYVISDIIKNPWNTQLYDLFVLLTIDEDNLYDISHYPIAKFLMNELMECEIKNGMISKQLHTVKNVVNGETVLKSFDSIIGIIKIITNCIFNCDLSLVSNFCNIFLIPNLKYLIGERLPTTRLNTRQSLLTHYILKLLFSIMKINDEMLDELCNGFYIFDLLLVPLKEFEPNIYILSSALELICYILLNPSTSDKYCNILIEEFNPSTLINNINTHESSFKLSNITNGLKSSMVNGVKSNMVNGVNNTYINGIGKTHMREVDSDVKFYNEIVDVEKYMLKMYSWYFKFISTLLYLSNTNFNLKEYVDDKLLSHDLVTKVTVNNVIILTLYPKDKIDSNIINQLLQMIDVVPSMSSNVANGVINSIVLTLVKRVELVNINYENVYKIIQLLMFTYNNPSSDPQDHVDMIHPVEVVSSNIVKLIITMISHSFKSFLKFNSIIDDNLMLLVLKCMKTESKMEKETYIETSIYKSYTQLINLCIYNNMLKYNSRQFFRLLFFYNYVILNDNQRNDSIDLIKYINNIHLDDLFNIEYDNVDITNVQLDIKNIGVRDSMSHFVEDSSYFETNMNEELSLIINLEIVDKLLLYLSPLYSIHFIHYYNERKKRNVNSEYWAGLIKGYKLTYEQFNVINEKEIIKRLKQFDNAVFVDDSNYFKLISTEILRSNLYEDVQINTSYIVSLYLRLLNNVMERDEGIKDKLKNPNFTRNLIKLTANHNIFDNHLTVKLFQFFIQLLKYDNQLIVESMDIIIIYDIITNFLQMIFGEMANEFNIENIISNDNIQKLLLYASEFLLLITEQIGLVKFSETYEIQMFFVDICIKKFINDELISGLINILNVIHFYNHIHVISTAETVSSDSSYQVGKVITSIVINIMYILISIIRIEDYKFLIVNNLLKNENTVILTIIIHEIKLNDSKQKFQLQLLNHKIQPIVKSDSIQRVILFNYISFITNLQDIFDDPNFDPRTLVLCLTNHEIYLINSEDTSVIHNYARAEVKLFNINKGLFYLLLHENDYLLFFINNNNHPITISDAQELVLEHTPTSTKSLNNKKQITTKPTPNTVSCVNTFDGIMCEYEDKLSILIEEDDWIAVYNVNVEYLIKYIYPELVEDKIILTNFLIPKYELKEKPPVIDPLVLVKQLVINNINKVEFNVNNYTVSLSDKESPDVVDLNLINFYNFESFKNLLYNKLYKTNNIWKRLLIDHQD
ncbi:uncharacterized protein TA04230 [Theileria annulata]|uniref:Uncharacterized protein n=1 Tax=Theileria annulata TaxID=5874 RepID=Q4UC61_THEAN|nr:uncharacterized protein TA04230 [Theileria annulata]CAI75590.1 hypothetical protein, conserved [Theileria annulata]|eukprot:XP_955066.1 hypothetical protein, conserved [Theileria annulata]